MAIPKNSLVHFSLQQRAAWWEAQEEKRAVASAIPLSVITLETEAAEGKGAQNTSSSYRSCFHHQILAYFSLLPESKKIFFQFVLWADSKGPFGSCSLSFGSSPDSKTGHP